MSAIALGPTTETIEPEIVNQNPDGEKSGKRENYHFADEIVINGQEVLTIPLEHQFYEEQKPKRKSRWGEKVQRKKIHQDVIFDPLKALTDQSNRLAIEFGEKPEDFSYLKPVKKVDNTAITINESKSKWGQEFEKTFEPPSIHFIPSSLANDEVEYILRLYRLDEVTKKIQIKDIYTMDLDLRSPSPPPVYDQKSGQRTNTRENRGMEKLQREKQDLIDECVALKSYFQPPLDHRTLKKSKKIYIPSDDPSVNYVGLVLGPRGTTKIALEKRCKCKISIRGKGSQRRDDPFSDDNLHIYLQADNDEQLEMGADLIDKVLKEEDEQMADIKKNQQLQLQAITGVLRDDYCENCFEKGHRIWACPQKITQTRVDIKCMICKERSHVTSDCPSKKEYEEQEKLQLLTQNRESTDLESDFCRFLAEVEGKNAQKLINLAGNVDYQEIKPVTAPLSLTDRMAFLTEYKPGLLSIKHNGENKAGRPTRFSMSSSEASGSNLALTKNLNVLGHGRVFDDDGNVILQNKSNQNTNNLLDTISQNINAVHAIQTVNQNNNASQPQQQFIPPTTPQTVHSGQSITLGQLGVGQGLMHPPQQLPMMHQQQLPKQPIQLSQLGNMSNPMLPQMQPPKIQTPMQMNGFQNPKMQPPQMQPPQMQPPMMPPHMQPPQMGYNQYQQFYNPMVNQFMNPMNSFYGVQQPPSIELPVFEFSKISKKQQENK